MPKTLPISEAKARLTELVAGVQEREEYERLKETVDVLGDAELMRQIRRSQRFYAKGGKGLTFEDVFGC